MNDWREQLEFSMAYEMIIGVSDVCCPNCNMPFHLVRLREGFQAECPHPYCTFGPIPVKPVESSTQLRRILKVYDALINPNS